MKCCEHGPVAPRQLRYYDAAAPVIANHYNSSIIQDKELQHKVESC